MRQASTTFTTSVKRLATLVVLSATFLAPGLWANVIAYQATSFTYAASLGSTTFGGCSPNFACVVVTINFTANTANIVPFNVTSPSGNASGYENFVGQGSVNLFNDQTGQSLSANFTAGQIFVSVDQTNGGIGFGSAVGPTYPLGVYAGNPSTPYASYNLASAFTVFDAFAWFCPTGTCTLGVPGPPLATDQGPLSITPIGPVFGSSFTATVVQITPEPSTIFLLGNLAPVVIFRRGLQSRFGILRRRH